MIFEPQLTPLEEQRVDGIIELLERLESRGVRVLRVALTRREIYQLGGNLGIAAYGFRFRGYAVRVLEGRVDR